MIRKSTLEPSDHLSENLSVDAQHLKENVKLNENKIISLIAVRFIYDFLFLFKMLRDLEEPDEDESVDACPFSLGNPRQIP